MGNQHWKIEKVNVSDSVGSAASPDSLRKRTDINQTSKKLVDSGVRESVGVDTVVSTNLWDSQKGS